MATISLKLFEFYNLDAELNGVTNQKTNEVVNKGLLQEKLSLVTKYWLSDLGKKAAAEKLAIDELKNDLIRKYGKPDDQGGITIPLTIDELDLDGQPVLDDISANGERVNKKILNPDFQAFNEEFNTLLKTEKELTYHDFSIEDFAKVETTDNFPTFFELLTNVKPA